MVTFIKPRSYAPINVNPVEGESAGKRWDSMPKSISLVGSLIEFDLFVLLLLSGWCICRSPIMLPDIEKFCCLLKSSLRNS